MADLSCQHTCARLPENAIQTAARSNLGSAASMNSSNTSAFLELPREIRNEIYKHYLTDGAIIVQPGPAVSVRPPYDANHSSKGLPPIWPLLCTCFQILHEATAIFYEMATVKFEQCRDLIVAACWNKLRHITFSNGPDKVEFLDIVSLDPSERFKLICDLRVDIGVVNMRTRHSAYQQHVRKALHIVHRKMPKLQKLQYCLGKYGDVIERQTFPRAWLLEILCQAHSIPYWRMHISSMAGENTVIYHIWPELGAVLSAHCQSKRSNEDGDHRRIGQDRLTGVTLRNEILTQVIQICEPVMAARLTTFRDDPRKYRVRL